jgi:hypothetical protein
VYHTTAPSIRIQPSTQANYRESCGRWYSVKPGDHIVAKCWIKVSALAGFVYNPYNAATRRGARILIDLYGHGHWLDSYPNTAAQDIAIIVPWGTQGWVLKTWDFIVPSKTYTIPVQYDPHPTSPAYRGPSQINCIVMVLNCGNHGGGLDKANAWFSEPVLYINP